MFEPLARYAEMNAALCPIPAGGKSPVGHIASFAHDWSRDPKQWLAWSQQWPGCNWIMVAGPSSKIVIDIDVKKVGRDAAWQAWVQWCADHDSPVLTPQIQTPSQGWHIYCDVPSDVDSLALRQPPLVSGIIDTRAGMGFVLIPPSHVDGKAYAWMG